MAQRLLVLTADPDQDLTDRIPQGCTIEKIAVCPAQPGSGRVSIALVLTEQIDDPESGMTWGRRHIDG